MSLIYDALKQDDDGSNEPKVLSSSLALHQYNAQFISKRNLALSGFIVLMIGLIGFLFFQNPTVLSSQINAPLKQDTNVVMVTKPIQVTEPIKVVEASKVAEPIEVVEASKVAEPIEVVEASKVAEPIKVVEASKVAEPIEVVEASKVAELIKVVEASKVVEPIEVVEASKVAEPIKVVAASKSAEAIKVVAASKAAEEIKVAASIKELNSPRDRINDVKRLVAQLKNTIQNENIAQTTALLQQLEQKAGKNSIVTLRMNGYWALQQNMNQDSRQFYQQLLMQQPDDLEANMNIALLDVRLGDNDKAKNRLNKMMVLYPESSSVKQFTKSLASMGLR
jgi:hypothetical protein